MHAIFYVLPWPFTGLLIVACCVAVSVGGLLLVRRRYHLATLKANHEVAGFTFGVIGMLYGVLLGFVVVQVWDQFNDAASVSETEANLITDLYRNTAVFPNETALSIRAALRQYANRVAVEEWPMMAKGLSSQAAQSDFEKIWQLYHQFNPGTDQERIWYATSIERLNQLSDSRQMRLVSCRQDVSGMMWTLLIMGGLVSTGFMYFFGLENLRSQMIMTALLSGCVAFILFFVLSMDHPYEGDISVRPDAFHFAIDVVDTVE